MRFILKNTDDLSGNKYGRLLVLHETKKIKGRYRAWFCRCDCGSNVEVRENSLKLEIRNLVGV
ncbi:hypothetical protein Phab24_id110 [Acinetobacter phage Phab24]|nr:hypothetical protein Phab24_id110 [Acinetobacter phage Phab24]